MLFGKVFYMIHRTISVSFLRDTIRSNLGAFFQGKQRWKIRMQDLKIKAFAVAKQSSAGKFDF